jgi:hypothetical protein
MTLTHFKTAAAALAMAAIAGAAHATTYTSDTNLADFASASTQFATLSNYTSGDVASPYATTFASLSAGLRVYGGGGLPNLSSANNWILASFAGPVSTIRVFPNIDHFGSQYDGYQYTIEGSNDGSNWTQLFDSTSVSGANEPFTLGTFTGTAPTNVDNVLTGASGPGGTVGYIADFTFGSAYKYYAFGASTVAFAQGNSDQELSGVSAIPEPASWAMMIVGFAGIGGAVRLGRRAKIALA